jgi:hypothetical protein
MENIAAATNKFIGKDTSKRMKKHKHRGLMVATKRLLGINNKVTIKESVHATIKSALELDTTRERSRGIKLIFFPVTMRLSRVKLKRKAADVAAGNKIIEATRRNALGT